MAMRESIQTNAPNLGELFANGRQYRVPEFQRNDSWGQTEWEDLWNDIVAAEAHGRDHYLGAIVLQRSPSDENSFEVIDGQQRLATLSILIIAHLAVLDAWVDEGIDPEENRERSELLRGNLVSPKEPTSLKRRSRLRLNRKDDAFYQSNLVNGQEPANESRLPKSEKALWDAWKFFRDRVAEHHRSHKDGAQLARFVEVVLARRLVFIEIVVDDEAAAYTVFETLNARGVALGTADLLKNFLFSKAAGGGGADLEEMQRQWDRLVDTVSLEHVADLIHHYANTRVKDVSKREVFRRTRDVVQSKTDAFEYMRGLVAAADWYQALLDPQDDLWKEMEDVRRWVRILRMLEATQYRPLALAAAPRLRDKPKDMERLFRILAIYTFRANVVLGRNTGDIYRAWNRAAVQVTERDACRPGELAASMRDIYGDDATFRSRFSELELPARGSRKKLLRYVLAELERDASKRTIDWETDSFTIEHVASEHGDEDWTGSEDQRARILHRIGNFVPLEAHLNREAANLDFASKLEIYARSAYSLPKSLAGTDWGPEQIRHRSQEYAKRAAHIWRVDL